MQSLKLRVQHCLTAIFQWEALSSADIASMTSNDTNYVWSGVDYNVGAACRANISLMDFRIGDTWHVRLHLPIPSARTLLSFAIAHTCRYL